MVDPITFRRWLFRLIFLGIAIVVVFVRILPLDLTAGRWPGPDILAAIAFAWVLRRPDYVPVVLVAAVMLIADFVFMRPPGLWAALTIIGLEFLRSREHLSRDLPFLFEWAMVSVVFLGMTVGCRLILAIFVVGQPKLSMTMLELSATVLCYPLVVAVSRWIIGVRKIAPGEVDQLGHPI